MASVHAAVDNGADEVYLGVRLAPVAGPFVCTLGLRGQGTCFTLDQVLAAREYCSKHGADLHVCLNNHYSERLFEQAQEAARQCYERGVRHFVVSDLPFVDWLGRTYPDVFMSVSVLGGSTNRHTAGIYKGLGARRVTLEACFTVEDIGRISAAYGLETEVFVFGSPCVAHHGTCFLHAYRSAERVQGPPCVGLTTVTTDQGDKSGCYMKLRDIEGIQIIPDLARAGVTAVKIEGRLKSPHYVKVTTRAARYVLDAVKDGRDPALPRGLLRSLERVYFFSKSPGYLKSRQPEPDCLCIDGGSGFNRLRDFLRTRGGLAVATAVMRHAGNPKRSLALADPYLAEREMDPQVAAALASLPVTKPKLVADVSLMYPVIPRGADRICIGERHCAIAFLHRSDSLLKLVDEARATGAQVYVTIPGRVREHLVDAVLDVVSGLRGKVDGALCYDLGIAARLKGEVPVTVAALALSPRSYGMVADVAGAQAVRPLHFPLPAYLDEGFPPQPVEIPVFGHMALGSTITCLSRIWTGCPEKEPKVFPVKFEDMDLLLAGTSVYSGKVFSAHQVRDDLMKLQPAAFVLDTFNNGRDTIEHVLQFWRTGGCWPLPLDGLCNGMLADDSLLAGFGCGGSKGGWVKWLPDLRERLFGVKDAPAEPLLGCG